jgi:hypothetical protein
MAIMLLGVGVIVQDGLESGNLFGDAMAACSAFLLASAIAISRASGRDMALVPLTTAIFPALAALTLLPASGIAIAAPGYILFNGLVMIPVAFFCLATGPRYLSAPEVGMFYLLETILAPIWVWMVFSETPTFQTLVGGTILIIALLGHSLWQMRSKAAKAQLPCAEVPVTGGRPLAHRSLRGGRSRPRLLNLRAHRPELAIGVDPFRRDFQWGRIGGDHLSIVLVPPGNQPRLLQNHHVT